MKLPRASDAIVDRGKVVSYLLNLQHPYGASKARYFTSFGFSSERWEEMAQALRQHAQDHEVREMNETEFGTRYQIDGQLIGPNRLTLNLRTVWQWDKGQLAPRLITAYPLEP
jgi:hypothetical protein